MTRAAREGVRLPRCPLTSVLAPHERGTGERQSDELAAAYTGGPTIRERHERVMEHLRERAPGGAR